MLRTLNRGAKALERAVQVELRLESRLELHLDSRLELHLVLQLEPPKREPAVAWWARDRGFRCGISAAIVRTARGSSGLSQV